MSDDKNRSDNWGGDRSAQARAAGRRVGKPPKPAHLRTQTLGLPVPTYLKEWYDALVDEDKATVRQHLVASLSNLYDIIRAPGEN